MRGEADVRRPSAIGDQTRKSKSGRLLVSGTETNNPKLVDFRRIRGRRARDFRASQSAGRLFSLAKPKVRKHRATGMSSLCILSLHGLSAESPCNDRTAPRPGFGGLAGGTKGTLVGHWSSLAGGPSAAGGFTALARPGESPNSCGDYLAGRWWMAVGSGRPTGRTRP
jgi:hypothetical protein